MGMYEQHTTKPDKDSKLQKPICLDSQIGTYESIEESLILQGMFQLSRTSKRTKKRVEEREVEVRVFF